MTTYSGDRRGRSRTAKDVKHTSEKPSEQPLSTLGLIAMIACVLCGVLSTVISGTYIGASQAADGMSGFDVAVTIAVFGALGAALITLSYLGVRVIPTLHGPKRARAMIVYAALFTLSAAISMPTGFLQMGLGTAYQAQSIANIERIQDRAGEAQVTVQTLDALAGVAGGAAADVRGMADRETTTGAVSGTASGVGETADSLRSIAELLGTTEEALIAARADAAPLERRIRELTSALRRVMISGGDPAQVGAQVDDLLTQLVAAFEALRQVAPIAQLEVTVDRLSTDWRAAGLNAEASARMSAAFDPLALRFAIAIAQLRSASDGAALNLADERGFSLLLSQMESVWPILVFVVLLDALPLGICLIVWATSSRGDEEETDDEDGPDIGVSGMEPVWPHSPLPMAARPNGAAALLSHQRRM